MGTKSNIKKIFFVIFAGIILGMFILFYMGLTTRWMVSFSLALMILFIGLSLKNPKHFFLGLFAFALPIQVVNYLGRLSPSLATHTGGPAGLYVTFLDFPLLMLYIFWIPKIFIAKTVKFHSSKLDICIFGLIVMSILSTINTPFFELSFYGIIQLIKVYLIFLYFSNAITTKSDLRYFIAFLLAGVLFQSILGILQFYGGERFIIPLTGRQVMREQSLSIGMMSRVSGTLGHPTHLAEYLILFIPLIASLALTLEKMKHRILCMVIFSLSIVTMILTLARACWIALIISMGIFLILCLKTKLFSLRHTKVITILVLLSFLGIVFIFQAPIYSRFISDDYGSAYSRIPLMKVALNTIKAHPFIGVGINNYAEAMWRYDNTIEQISSAIPWVVHNQYLFIASEIGLVGLFFFLYFVILIFKNAIRIVYYEDKFDKAIAIGFLSAIIGFLLAFIVDSRALSGPVFLCFWTYSGIIMAVRNMRQKVYLSKNITQK